MRTGTGLCATTARLTLPRRIEAAGAQAARAHDDEVVPGALDALQDLLGGQAGAEDGRVRKVVRDERLGTVEKRLRLVLELRVARVRGHERARRASTGTERRR